MIKTIAEVVLVECDNDECFESFDITVHCDEDVWDKITFSTEWEVCFDPQDDTKMEVFCPKHSEGVYDEVDTD